MEGDLFNLFAHDFRYAYRIVRQYLEFIADQRLAMLGLPKIYKSKNPFSFMDLQDVQELTNFFERRVSADQVSVAGKSVLAKRFNDRGIRLLL